MENKQYLNDALGSALLNARWFNNIYVIPYLINKGADLYFASTGTDLEYSVSMLKEP